MSRKKQNHMKWKSNCPKCGARQTRWEIYDPLLGFINQCKYCGTDYKSDKFSNYCFAITGLAIVAIFILADKGFIPWIISLLLIVFLVSAIFYLSPYLTTCIEDIEIQKDIAKKWMIPFFRYQLFIIIFIIILVAANVFMQGFNKWRSDNYLGLVDKIENTSSIGRLQSIAKQNNALLLNEIRFQTITSEFNTAFSIIILFLIFQNLIFYYKIRHSHNKPIHADPRSAGR